MIYNGDALLANTNYLLSPMCSPPSNAFSLSLPAQVQPDLEELTTNMELPDEQLQKPQEKLGRLQYRIDYDFGQNNVSRKTLVSIR